VLTGDIRNQVDLLGKIASAGQNGQFRTPRHAIGLMVEMMEPQPRDRICDPAAGTCGFLVAAGEYLREHHQALWRMLVEEHKLDAVVKLPSGVFRPYAGVSTAILCFTKTGVGGTDQVWFYDVQADGYSLDDKRNPLLPAEKLGPTPREPLTDEDHVKNNLPDVLRRWRERDGTERERPRTAQSFCVPKAEIAAGGTYDLSLNRYREVEHVQVEHDAPADIIRELREIEAEISTGLTRLEEMLK
jgi:type I restriction enzyme M protein